MATTLEPELEPVDLEASAPTSTLCPMLTAKEDPCPTAGLLVRNLDAILVLLVYYLVKTCEKNGPRIVNRYFSIKNSKLVG